MLVKGKKEKSFTSKSLLRNSMLVPRLGSCVLSPSPSVVFPCFNVMMSVYLSSLYTKRKQNDLWKIRQIHQQFQWAEVLQQYYSVYLHNCPLRYSTIGRYRKEVHVVVQIIFLPFYLTWNTNVLMRIVIGVVINYRLTRFQEKSANWNLNKNNAHKLRVRFCWQWSM